MSFFPLWYYFYQHLGLQDFISSHFVVKILLDIQIIWYNQNQKNILSSLRKTIILTHVYTLSVMLAGLLRIRWYFALLPDSHCEKKTSSSWYLKSETLYLSLIGFLQEYTALPPTLSQCWVTSYQYWLQYSFLFPRPLQIPWFQDSVQFLFSLRIIDSIQFSSKIHFRDLSSVQFSSLIDIFQFTTLYQWQTSRIDLVRYSQNQFSSSAFNDSEIKLH